MMATKVCDLQWLPRKPEDATDVCDRYGNRWKFSSDNDTWISHGVLQPPVIVTETNDGVITTDIISKLSRLRTTFNNINLDPLKIAPGKDAYWYYFHSSDKFIKFIVEGEDALRLEVDRGRLFQVLMKQICPGPRGITGPIGAQGDRGIAGPAELSFEPSIIIGDRLDFAIYTPTPLLGDRADILLPNNHIPDISVRIFKINGLDNTQAVIVKPSIRKKAQQLRTAEAHDQLHYLAVRYHGLDGLDPKFHKVRDVLMRQSMGTADVDLCDIKLSRVLSLPIGAVLDDTPRVSILIDPIGAVPVRVIGGAEIDADRTIASIQFDPVTNIVCGSVFLKNAVWSGDWCVKSRQKGPDGISGAPGVPALTVVNRSLDTSNIFATCPIIAARFDPDQNAIFTTCSDIANSICVDSVRILRSAGRLNSSGAIDATFAAVQVILDECKFINRFAVALIDDIIDDPDFAHWDPQPGCVSKRNYDRHSFDWMANTDSPACDPAAIWYDSALVARGGLYSSPLVTQKSPLKDSCCAEDFFYCPNVQDSGCSSTGGVSTTPPPVLPPPVGGGPSTTGLPGILAFSVAAGSTFLKTVTWESGGSVVDLTGYTATMVIRGSGVVLDTLTISNGLIIDGPAGAVTITIPAQATATFPVGSYTYDLMLLSPTGINVDLLTGTFTVTS